MICGVEGMKSSTLHKKWENRVVYGGVWIVHL